MRRRRILNLLVAVAFAVTATACSTGKRPATDEPKTASTTAAGDTPTSPSSLDTAPRMPPGVAPSNPFAVGVREIRLNRGDDRPLPVTVWYPATGRAGGEPQPAARVAEGRFPIVVFSHGLTGLPADYAPLLTRWAAAGLIVAAPAYPYTSRGGEYNVLDVMNQPADASYVLTEILALDAAAVDPLRGHLATDRVAAAGHSAGGITTIGLFTLKRDERFVAGIVLAGSALGVGTAFQGPAAPQLFVHGVLDEVVAYEAGRAAYEKVPWPKAMLSLPDGDHGQSLLRDGSPAFTIVVETTVDFLRWSLYGDATARSRLATNATAGGVATFDDQF
ncbi:MAG TPA: chlorophyllase [Micromonosporaceae bacterium]|nr:chlorophyllase [Micromonosporaceae bacterium]